MTRFFSSIVAKPMQCVQYLYNIYYRWSVSIQKYPDKVSKTCYRAQL